MRVFLLICFCVGLACDTGDGIYYETAPEPQSVSQIELKQHRDEVTLVDGQARYDFEIEPGVQSFLLSLKGVSEGEYLITELDGPDGRLVRAEATSSEAASGLGAAAAPFFSPNRSVGDHGGATLLVPNEPRLRLTPGSWQATIISTHRASHLLRIDRLEQHAAARPAAVSLPLTIHLTGADNMSVTTAVNHPRLQRALTQVRAIFAAQSIEINPIVYNDISPDFAQLDGVALRSDQAKDMLALGRDNLGINLFVIERFLNDEDLIGSVGGVSAAIPGDPRGGQLFSAVVVATSFSEDDPARDVLGLTMAHEIGHFLGLFHTLEANGLTDHLVDTDDNSNDNLMHHLSRPGVDVLTDHQGMVLRAHPAVGP